MRSKQDLVECVYFPDNLIYTLYDGPSRLNQYPVPRPTVGCDLLFVTTGLSV
jgi:hypothetical protein